MGVQNPDGTYDTVFVVISRTEAAAVRRGPSYLALTTRATALGAQAILSDVISDVYS